MMVFCIRPNSTLYARVLPARELLTFWPGTVLIVLQSDSEQTLFLTSNGQVARTPMPLRYITVLEEI